MFGIFRRHKITPIQDWVLKNDFVEKDAAVHCSKMIIAYSSAFVPLKPKNKIKGYKEKFYNDRTIVELATFLLFYFIFFLLVKKFPNRLDPTSKSIDYFLTTLNTISFNESYRELIDDRFALYGKVANSENGLIDCVELLHSIIISYQKNDHHYKMYSEGDFIPLSLDFILDSFFKNHLKNYVDEIMPNVLQLFDKVVNQNPQ